MTSRTFLMVTVVCCTITTSHSVAAEPVKPEHAAQMKAGLVLFRQEVRQILTGRCLKCHGGEKRESEFDLNTREALLKGGAEGAAVDLKAAGESRMLGMIEHRVEPHMPANAARLPDRQIASIRKWIELGAPYDRKSTRLNSSHT